MAKVTNSSLFQIYYSVSKGLKCPKSSGLKHFLLSYLRNFRKRKKAITVPFWFALIKYQINHAIWCYFVLDLVLLLIIAWNYISLIGKLRQGNTDSLSRKDFRISIVGSEILQPEQLCNWKKLIFLYKLKVYISSIILTLITNSECIIFVDFKY